VQIVFNLLATVEVAYSNHFDQVPIPFSQIKYKIIRFGDQSLDIVITLLQTKEGGTKIFLVFFHQNH
jgi:hypothetical protein